MQFTSVYVYKNRVDVIADIDPTLRTRNRIVYARTIKAHRGTDNQIVFHVKNSDQKPINLTGYTAMMSIVNDNDVSQFVELPGSLVDAAKGMFSVTIPENTMDLLDRQLYNYSVKIINSSEVEVPVYVDDFFGIRGQLEILDGYNPAFQISREVTLTNLSANVLVSSAVTGNYPSGYNLFHTFQFFFDNFSGTITPQVTTEPISTLVEEDWISQTAINYTEQTNSTHLTIEGSFTALRLRVNVTSGSVTKILARS
jgi:hypothetical protein